MVKRKKPQAGSDGDIPMVQETGEIRAIRNKWQFNGKIRPDFAEPLLGQAEAPQAQLASRLESVWDYPRPPAIQPVQQVLEVKHKGRTVAKTRQGRRVIETAGAPTYYFPPQDVKTGLLSLGTAGSLCEWKGYSQPLLLDDKEIGWRYVRMFPQFQSLYLWPSFYPSEVDCFIDGEQVSPQTGGYYGGWVTKNLVGPIKGAPGSQGW
jgi:uncharacterized protein (DUF427 family)